jgi:hypothetical protein
LSDGSSAIFKEITSAEFIEKQRNTLESSIYKTIYEELSNIENQKRLSRNFRNQKYTDEIQAMQ